MATVEDELPIPPMSAAAAAMPQKVPAPSSSIGDGKWLVLLCIVLAPGLYASAVGDSESCYSLYWFVTFLSLALGLVVFVHLLFWQCPRPASMVDSSPLTTIVACVVIGGPPVFGAWSAALLWPFGSADAIDTCPYSQHQPLWNFFALITVIEVIGLLAVVYACVQIGVEAMRPKVVSVGADGDANTFTSSPHLDNGRWLTMESRRIKEQEKAQ